MCVTFLLISFGMVSRWEAIRLREMTNSWNWLIEHNRNGRGGPRKSIGYLRSMSKFLSTPSTGIVWRKVKEEFALLARRDEIVRWGRSVSWLKRRSESERRASEREAVRQWKYRAIGSPQTKQSAKTKIIIKEINWISSERNSTK